VAKEDELRPKKKKKKKKKKVMLMMEAEHLTDEWVSDLSVHTEIDLDLDQRSTTSSNLKHHLVRKILTI
jgi:hypothetical protein